MLAFRRCALVLGLASVFALFAGCGGGGSTMTPTPPSSSPSFSFTVTSLDFGSVPTGSPKALSVSMVNNGSGSVTVTQFVVNDGEFTVSGISLPLTLNSKQTATGTITFTPSKTGTISASVSANSSSGALGSLMLNGIGLGGLAHSVDVSWTMSSTPGVVSYNIYRSSVSGGPYTKVGSSAATIFTDSTVQAGQTYFYVATAVDGSNTESVVSAEVSTTIPTP